MVNGEWSMVNQTAGLSALRNAISPGAGLTFDSSRLHELG
jgi:hypothetical protein